MRKIVITLILLEAAVTGQSVDLAGEWRRSSDDRPDYARAECDDRAWETVQLPWNDAPPLGVYWLRRSGDRCHKRSYTDLGGNSG